MSVTKGRPGQQRMLYTTSIKYDTPIDVTCFRKYADLLMRAILWQRELYWTSVIPIKSSN